MGGLPKKSVSWKDPLHRGGGPAESHREYYVGDAACEGGAGEPPQRVTTEAGEVKPAVESVTYLDPGKLEEGTGKWMREARVAQV
jgi:hypothetical protein